MILKKNEIFESQTIQIQKKNKNLIYYCYCYHERKCARLSELQVGVKLSCYICFSIRFKQEKA